jgi:hypothetical protein
MEDLSLPETGVHLSAEEFLEEPVSSEMITEDTVKLTRNYEGVTDSESEDDDPRTGEKVTSKKDQMWVEEIRKYFEYNLNINSVIQYTVALGTAIGKINEE